MRILSQILSVMFPPELPGRVRDWDLRVDESPADVQGTAGPARPKQYRNGIDRYFTQLRHAELQMAATREDLRSAGFVNTIHDCWESPEEVEDNLDDFMSSFPAVAELMKTRA